MVDPSSAGDEVALHAGLERAASERADAPAVRAGARTWSFADLQSMAERLSGHLAGIGVTTGDRIAVMCTNRVELLVVVHAVSRLGAAAVLLSPAWKALEVAHALELTGARVGIGDGEAVAVLRGSLGAHAVVDLDDAEVVAVLEGSSGAVLEGSSGAVLEGSSGAVLEGSSGAVPPTAPVDPSDEAVLVFSSGTTGLPKAVRHTHGSISVATRHWCEALGLGPDDRFQVATPPSHILGLLNLLAAVRAGATVRLHARFDLEEILGRIESERMTLEMAVAPIALAMANHPDLERFDLSSLRYIMWGATPVTPSVAEVVTRRTGVRWLPAYGASELPVLAANPVGESARWRLDSAGLPPAGVELRVAALDSGEVLPAGEVGEIQARSDSVMAGYLPPEATDAAFSADGWYRTGDVGWLEPEGWVHLTDRCKEMIKVKGFQVAPAEIEAVLHGHPGVADCAVFAIPDAVAGEVPVAAVQLDPGATVTADELSALVADNLATYKRLHHVVVVDTVPRLPSGKVLRRTLRERWEPVLVGAG